MVIVPLILAAAIVFLLLVNYFIARKRKSIESKNNQSAVELVIIFQGYFSK